MIKYESKTLENYKKAVDRLKHTGITDPTNIIAELECEIDYYNDLKYIINECDLESTW